MPITVCAATWFRHLGFGESALVVDNEQPTQDELAAWHSLQVANGIYANGLKAHANMHLWNVV